MSLPDASKIAAIESSLSNLVDSIEHHDQWTPPAPNRTLYFTWDFIKRTKYMMSEVDNIQNGRPLRHPDQFRPAPGTGPGAASKVFEDACGRCQMIDLLVTDTSGKTAMLTGQSGVVDFGPDVKAKSQEVLTAVANAEA